MCVCVCRGGGDQGRCGLVAKLIFKLAVQVWPVASVPRATRIYPGQRRRWDRGFCPRSATECGTSFGSQTFPGPSCLWMHSVQSLERTLSSVSQSGLGGWNAIQQAWEILGYIPGLSRFFPIGITIFAMHRCVLRIDGGKLTWL